MMSKFIVIILTCIGLCGCSLKLIPEPAEYGVINLKDNSQTISKEGITITVGGADAELYSYNLEGSVSAFTIIINNQTSNELYIDMDGFLLIDNEGHQYYPLTPEKVKEMISRDSYYLMPYPYVGFYYLEDYEKSSFYNTFNSQLPYFYEVYPQDLYTKSLAKGSLIPKAKVAGLMYFRIDLNSKKNVNLLFYKKGTSKSAAPDFSFPFKILK